MLSCTLQEYKNNYEANLSAYLLEYEDNTQTSFLEIELNIRVNYYNSLVKISDYFKNNTSKDLRINSAIKSVISDLKNINEQVFNEIFTIGKTKIVTERVTLENGFEDELILGSIHASIDINFKKLKNRITSSKRILDFISEQLTISHSSNNNATSLYLTGELPQGTSEQQTATPNDSLIVSKEAIPKKPLKKFPAKWYALQYLLELKADGLTPSLSTEGTFIRSELEKIGKIRTGLSGQSFYRAVLKYNDDLNHSKLLIKSFGKDWKNNIITLSENNMDLKDYLDKNY